MKYIMLLMVLVILVGCDSIQDYGPTNQPQPTPPSNETVQDDPKPTKSGLVNGTDNIFILSNPGVCVLVVEEDNFSTMIGCGGDLTAIGKLKDLGIESLDRMVMPSILAKDIQESEKLAIKYNPVNIYAPAIPNEYAFENEAVNKVLNTEIDGSLIIYPTYESRIFEEIDQNTLAISYEDIAITSQCYGKCEDVLNLGKHPIMYIANNGNCPTSSEETILTIDPEYIITNGGVCEEVANSIEAFGIDVIDVAQTDLHIYYEDGKLEIREVKI